MYLPTSTARPRTAQYETRSGERNVVILMVSSIYVNDIDNFVHSYYNQSILELDIGKCRLPSIVHSFRVMRSKEFKLSLGWTFESALVCSNCLRFQNKIINPSTPICKNLISDYLFSKQK